MPKKCRRSLALSGSATHSRTVFKQSAFLMTKHNGMATRRSFDSTASASSAGRELPKIYKFSSVISKTNTAAISKAKLFRKRLTYLSEQRRKNIYASASNEAPAVRFNVLRKKSNSKTKVKVPSAKSVNVTKKFLLLDAALYADQSNCVKRKILRSADAYASHLHCLNRRVAALRSSTSSLRLHLRASSGEYPARTASFSSEL